MILEIPSLSNEQGNVFIKYLPFIQLYFMDWTTRIQNSLSLESGVWTSLIQDSRGPLVDPDGLDGGVGGHGVDQRHVLAVCGELSHLHTVQGPVCCIYLEQPS